MPNCVCCGRYHGKEETILLVNAEDPYKRFFPYCYDCLVKDIREEQGITITDLLTVRS